MPGHSIPTVNFKDPTAFEHFTCTACSLLLKDPVQLCCGDRFCKTCADQILAKDRPVVCPKCEAELKGEERELVSIALLSRAQVATLSI